MPSPARITGCRASRMACAILPANSEGDLTEGVGHDRLSEGEMDSGNSDESTDLAISKNTGPFLPETACLQASWNTGANWFTSSMRAAYLVIGLTI